MLVVRILDTVGVSVGSRVASKFPFFFLTIA